MKIKILCFVDYYLPGYKAGGPVRTIVNMIENLGDEFDFYIVTRDRDIKSRQPYTDVKIDAWNTVGNARVFYASPKTLSFSGVRRLLRNTVHDTLYLNSFFSPIMTGLPLLIRRFGLYAGKFVIIAPRGEFSSGALALKSNKKKAYITIAKGLGLYQDVFWQASTTREAEDIYRALDNRADCIRVAPNLLPYSTAHLSNFVSKERVSSHGSPRKPGSLRIVFLSRISPMKNLDFLLQVLGKVSEPVQLSIYGPLEDAEYWTRCQLLIRKMPGQTSVQYLGEVMPEQVSQVFSTHDVFIFPTLGENFGHVIFEALSSGTPVIVSDQTPWYPDAGGAVEVLSLEQPEHWVSTIRKWSLFSGTQLAARRIAAMNYATAYVRDSKALKLNRELFTQC